MEFKFRAVDDNNPPPTTSTSLSPVTYIPDQSLQLYGSFSGSQMPFSSEAALRREIEKEQIRREILRRMELEEEVRRELAMEKELGISLPRPLMNMQGLMSHWSNSTLMNPAAAAAHIDASQPSSILPPAEINPSPEIGDKDKVIVLDKPDPGLFNAKRKATTSPISETEPLAFSLKKKLKEEWSCALCNIKATSESGLNAHLAGKKHKAREAGQNRMIAKRNKKSGENVMVAETVVNTTKLVVDAEKDQLLLHPCTALEVMNETAVVDKGVEESKKEDQLVKTVADNDANATESKNEKFAVTMVGKNITELKNEEQLVETMADNSVMLKVNPINENELVEMMVSNDVIKFENGVLILEKSQNVGSLECIKDAATEEAEKTSALTKMKIEEQLEETMADNGATWKVKPINENELVEMMVSNDAIKFENGGRLVEKSQNVGSLESKKDAAMETSALTKRSKGEPLWCEICQINTFSKVVMEGHVKGKKHIKKMKKFGQNNVSPPSTSSVSQKPPSLINDAEIVNKETG